MKSLSRFLLVSTLAFAAPVCAVIHLSGCANPPSARVVQARTLGVLGSTAKAGMDGATQLLKQGRLTVDQWRTIANYYDLRWQPAYNLAVAAVRSNLDSIAGPDLQKLADEFLALLAQYSASTPR